MEVLVELFLTFMIDGTAIFSNSRKTPKSLRILTLSFIIVLMFMLLYLSYYSRSSRIGMWAFLILGSAIALFLTNLLSEYRKMKAEGRNE